MNLLKKTRENIDNNSQNLDKNNISEIKHNFNDNQNKVDDNEHKEKKTLNERIEDLVNAMEKTNKLIKKSFSLKAALLRGMLQGLGFIIGTTVLAGLVYSLSIKFFGKEIIDNMTLENVKKANVQKK